MRAIVLGLLSAAIVVAQQRAGTPLYPGGAPGPRSPIPSVINPGTPTQLPRGFGPGVRGTGSVIRGAGPAGPVGGQGRGQFRRTIVPLPVPFYGGGYYPQGGGYYPQDGYAAAPPIVIQQTPPPVYINRDYQPEQINPVLRDYSNAQLPEAVPQQAPMRVLDAPFPGGANLEPEEPTIYLIAFQDQTVIPALAYWVEGDTLRYVTRQHALNAVSLDLIDRAFSTKLNRERGVAFTLPRGEARP